MKISLSTLLARIPGAVSTKWPEGERFTAAFNHGTMSVEAYTPSGTDPQTPHAQDELYFIQSGKGELVLDGVRHTCLAGDAFFVSAGVEHHFENFSNDFTTWVVFWGPQGGERGAQLFIPADGLRLLLNSNVMGKQTVMMIDKNFAEHFARDWIDSWNSHALDRVLSHYSDQFEMSSPAIVQVVGEPSGMLKGKEAIGAYWLKALQRIPKLQFELVTTLIGVNSITLYYKGPRGLSAEVFHFGPDEKVIRAYAHYSA